MSLFASFLNYIDDNTPLPKVADDYEDSLVAIGGSITVNRLLEAYSKGIFPWYSEGEPVLWHSPIDRGIITPESFKVSRSLKQILKQNKFEVRIDTDFEQVIRQCAQTRIDNEIETWITDDLQETFIMLHKMGVAHSFETYQDGELVGGLYGMSLGKAFFGESMFTLQSNASKVAFERLVRFAKEKEFLFIDCQVINDYTESLGAFEIPRKDFHKLLKTALSKEGVIGNWGEV